jgi:hypothetical protein
MIESTTQTNSEVPILFVADDTKQSCESAKTTRDKRVKIRMAREEEYKRKKQEEDEDEEDEEDDDEDDEEEDDEEYEDDLHPKWKMFNKLVQSHLNLTDAFMRLVLEEEESS